MSEDIKLVHDALNEIKTMVTEKTKDVVTEEKFNKVSNDLTLCKKEHKKLNKKPSH